MVCVLAIDTHPAEETAPIYRRLRSHHGHEISVVFAAEAPRWRELAKCVWQTRPEVIMWSGYTNPLLHGAMAQLALVPIPWLLHTDTTDHMLQRSHWRAVARDALLRALYARSSALAYIGHRAQRHCRRLGVPERKLFFAPLGVDTEQFKPEEADRTSLRRVCRSQLQVPERRMLFLYCGELTEHKDPTRLVHALRALPALLRQRATLVFVGDGELAAQLTQLAAAEPQLDVRLVGAKPQTELSAYYHAADALVLTSREGEAWGRVVTDTLLHGTPCIVSHQVGCAPDLIVPGETGEVFEAGNTESLARAMERIWPRLGTRACRDQARARSAGYTIAAAASGLSASILYATRG